MRIQHNVAALNAHRQLGGNNNAVGRNLEKLSSGFRINRAGDDAAGLAISEKMRAQIKGLQTASKNAQDGVSLIQTAEGALTEVHSMLNRMVELATQSANGTYGSSERQKLDDEVTALKDEIDRISEGTNFNGINLLDGKMDSTQRTASKDVDLSADKLSKFSFTASADGGKPIKVSFVASPTEGVKATATGDELTLTLGAKKGGVITQEDIDNAIKEHLSAAATTDTIKADFKDLKVTISEDITASDVTTGTVTKVTSDASAATGKSLELQVGDTNDSFQKVNVNVKSMSSKSLGLDAVTIADQDSAGNSIQMIKNAIEEVSTARSDLGALQNRLDHTINNLGVTTENMTAAESRIRDVDMAEEMMDFTKNNILTQAAQAMLAQANQLPQGVLQLLQ